MASEASSSAHNSWSCIGSSNREACVPRSSYLEEYSSKCRPLSAGTRPRTLLHKVVQAAGLGADADSDADVEADTWVLDGWGEEPSVPLKACQVATRLVPKWARNLPCALPASTGPGMRRIASAGTHRSSPGRGRKQHHDSQNHARRRRVPAVVGSEAADVSKHTRQVPGAGRELRQGATPVRTQPCQARRLAALDAGEESDGSGPSWPHTMEQPTGQPRTTAVVPAVPTRVAPAPTHVNLHGSPPKAVAAGKLMGAQTQQLVKLLGTGGSPVQAQQATGSLPVSGAEQHLGAADRNAIPLEHALSGWSQSQDERASGCEELASGRRTPCSTERPSVNSLHAGAPGRGMQDIGGVAGGRRPGYGALTCDAIKPIRQAVHAPIDPLHGPTTGAATTARAVALAAGVAASARMQAGAAATGIHTAQAAQSATAAAQLAAARTAAKAKLQADLQVLQRLHQVPRSPSPSILSAAQGGIDNSNDSPRLQPISDRTSAQSLLDRLTVGCPDDAGISRSSPSKATHDAAHQIVSNNTGSAVAGSAVGSTLDTPHAGLTGVRRGGPTPVARQQAPTTVQHLELRLPGALAETADHTGHVVPVARSQPPAISRSDAAAVSRSDAAAVSRSDAVAPGPAAQGVHSHSTATAQDSLSNQSISYAAGRLQGTGKESVSTALLQTQMPSVGGSVGAGLGPGPPPRPLATGRGPPPHMLRATSSPPAGFDAATAPSGSRRFSRASSGYDAVAFLPSAHSASTAQPGALCTLPSAEAGRGAGVAEHGGKLPTVGKHVAGLEVVSTGLERRQSLQRIGSDAFWLHES